MFFYEGIKVLGQLENDLIKEVRDFALGIDYNEKRFSRTEPALKYTNHLVSVPSPIVESAAYVQDTTGINFSPIVKLLDSLKKMPTFNGFTAYACEVSYLEPKSKLVEHTDVRFYHLVGRRVQVPLLVDDSCFISRGRSFKLETPNVYEIDNISPHLAANNADTPKVSLLIDFLDTGMLAEERKLNRFPRRRVLYYSVPPEKDPYR